MKKAGSSITGKLGQRNTILIGAFIVCALIISIWLTGKSSGGAKPQQQQQAVSGASAAVETTPFHMTVDGGLFAIIEENDNQDCGTFITRGTNPMSVLAGQETPECMSISLGLLFHAGEPSEAAAITAAGQSAETLAKWAKATSYCGDVTLMAMPHGAGGLDFLHKATLTQVGSMD